jgi:hypothetical protein
MNSNELNVTAPNANVSERDSVTSVNSLNSVTT